VSAAVSRTGSPAGLDHVSANMPSAPAFETAAASSGTADIGACTIGSSIPSNSQTGVRTTTTYPVAPIEAPATGIGVDRPSDPGLCTFAYDSYDEGIASGPRLFHP
jgi:hypothetical protein